MADRNPGHAGDLIKVVALLSATAIAIATAIPLRATIRTALIAAALVTVAWAMYVTRNGVSAKGRGASLRLLSLVVVSIGMGVFAYTSLEAVSDQSVLISLALGILIVAASWAGLSAVDGLSRSRFILFLLLAGGVLTGIVVATHQNQILSPVIDVPMFQTVGADYLLRGVNPYAGEYPDLYGSMSSLFYGPGLSVDGVLQFGFPYLPAALLIVAPFQWLFGDVRLALVLAVLLTSFVISRTGRSRLATTGAIGAVVLAPSPLIVTGGWIEPLLGLGISFVVLSLASDYRQHSVAMGLVVALKQYAVLLLPAYLLAMPRPINTRKIFVSLGIVVGVVSVLTVPFFLWSPEAFVDSVIVVQFKQPLRPDSLSATVQWIASSVALSNSALTALPLFAYVGSLLFAWRFVERGAPTTFGIVGALTLGMFFLFSKQAFANYYFLVVLLLLTSVAADRRGTVLLPEVDRSPLPAEF